MARVQKYLVEILRLADANNTVAQIVAQIPLSESRIYGILRQYRPTRKRTKKSTTSALPAKIQALAVVEGMKPVRAMELLGISRAYVYRHWPKKEEM